jgi:hypothetical protein
MHDESSVLRYTHRIPVLVKLSSRGQCYGHQLHKKRYQSTDLFYNHIGHSESGLMRIRLIRPDSHVDTRFAVRKGLPPSLHPLRVHVYLLTSSSVRKFLVAHFQMNYPGYPTATVQDQAFFLGYAHR